MNGQVFASLLVEALLIFGTTVFLAQPPWAFGDERKLKPSQLRNIGFFLLFVTIVWSVIMGFALAI